jgi:hypothetical protein
MPSYSDPKSEAIIATQTQPDSCLKRRTAMSAGVTPEVVIAYLATKGRTRTAFLAGESR